MPTWPPARRWTRRAPYGVQDAAFSPAAHVRGCYANVIGLPLCTVASMLAEHGVTAPEAARWQPPSESMLCAGCEALVAEGGRPA